MDGAVFVVEGIDEVAGGVAAEDVELVAELDMVLNDEVDDEVDEGIGVDNAGGAVDVGVGTAEARWS